jgi:hypothetical protein
MPITHLIVILLSGALSHAATVANVEVGAVYKKQPRSSAFCDTQVVPVVEVNEDKKTTLALGARVGFVWENLPSERVHEGGCTFDNSQKIEEQGNVTTLVLQTSSDCKGEPSDSQRETLNLKGKEITYKVEPLKRSKDGKEWILDTKKPSYLCVWKAK